ncbi:MAG: hypothetical protein LBK53_08630 [Heliobacteriaceae bacterium]|jgi:hypothetical protein|nr:hypothetical protein [Heliobacteriaceae bacterium]
MSDLLKQLTGKNKNDYEQAARHLINTPDVELFKELVENDSFLFDFVKQNVADRMGNAVNDSNYLNLLQFLKSYSPSYEEVIILNLVKRADEDLTDEMLEKLENGTIDEQTYAAKYFSFIKDPLSAPFLKNRAYGSSECLVFNSAQALAAQGDTESYHDALQKLKSEDEFEKLAAVKFLAAYGNKDAAAPVIEAMKESPLAENIAGELPYLEKILNLGFEDALLVTNNIINGLGEILELCTVLDFGLYEVLESFIKSRDESAVTLLNAIDKFETLTENDEYIFDEDKETKNEIYDIKKLLHGLNRKDLLKHVNTELREDSPFVYTALEFATDLCAVRELLKSGNQTLILKTAEVLKALGNLDESTKTVAMLKVTDGNIKSIIRAL